MSNDVLETISLIMIGDNSVGKTTLMKKFITGKYCDSFAPTLGVELYKKEIEINNKQYLIRIWDTCGQERFRSLSKSYFRNSDGIMLLFDLNSTKRFDNLSSWFNSIKDCGCEDIPMIIVGTKCDLECLVSKEAINQLEEDNKLILNYFKCSSKENIGVEEPFIELAKIIVKLGKTRERENSKIKIKKSENLKKKTKRTCC
jgi:small GTP-binding protein